MIKYQSETVSSAEMTQRADKVLAFSQKRRSVREFSNTPVSREIIEKLILTAGSAPSGANMQPWTFCAISDAALKREIRTAAEKEEYESYTKRMNEEWLKDLEKFETDWQKPFLEEAPWLIIVFKQTYGLKPDGSKKQHYYVNESVGLACGFLIKAIHECGLVTLTHTPSPMGFLSEILERPANEKPFLLLPVGYASEKAMVPKLEKKTSEELINWY